MKPIVYVAAAVALGFAGSASALDSHRTGAMLLAQAETPAPEAPAGAQEQAVDENPNQTAGKIAEIDATAHTLKLEDGMVFTVNAEVDLSSFSVGDSVLITHEPDTQEASSVKKADDVPEENDPDAPVEGQPPPESPMEQAPAQ